MSLTKQYRRTYHFQMSVQPQSVNIICYSHFKDRTSSGHSETPVRFTEVELRR